MFEDRLYSTDGNSGPGDAIAERRFDPETFAKVWPRVSNFINEVRSNDLIDNSEFADFCMFIMDFNELSVRVNGGLPHKVDEKDFGSLEQCVETMYTEIASLYRGDKGKL